MSSENTRKQKDPPSPINEEDEDNENFNMEQWFPDVKQKIKNKKTLTATMMKTVKKTMKMKVNN